MAALCRLPGERPVIPLLLVATVASIVAALLYGAYRWRGTTHALHARLLAPGTPVAQATYEPTELDGLPPPVQRYFRSALTDGQPIIAAARFAHTGTFNMGETTPSWRAFSSRQVVSTPRPGFVWDARVRMAPGVPVFVRDAYVAGEPSLHAEVLGLVTVADEPPTPELAHGELMRYLAEAMWYPTALLPSQGVRWTPIDDSSARATLTDGPTTVSLDFRFGADGLIASSTAPARSRKLGQTRVSMPWTGRAWAHDLRDGMRIPLEAEVSWIQPDGPYPYWRGGITRVEYEYARGVVHTAGD